MQILHSSLWDPSASYRSQCCFQSPPVHKRTSNKRLQQRVAFAGDEVPGITFSEHVLPLVSAAAIPWAAKQLWENVFKPQKCQGCYGTGSLVCPKCLARGKVGGVFVDKGAQCKRCRGCGRVPCLDCEGSGVKNSWLWKVKADAGWGPRGEA